MKCPMTFFSVPACSSDFSFSLIIQNIIITIVRVIRLSFIAKSNISVPAKANIQLIVLLCPNSSENASTDQQHQPTAIKAIRCPTHLRLSIFCS